MNADDFAYDEYKDLTVYQQLAKDEKNKEFKKILDALIEHEQDHYNFWLTLSTKKRFTIKNIEIWFYKFIRKFLGLTFTAKLLEGHEKEAIAHYREFLKTAKGETKKKVEHILADELEDEKWLISRIKEEQVEFISSIILGLNDGLIELTGALVGFSFAFANHSLVALSGLITGIAASMSMASSAYMQARHEEGKDARKSGIYTGVSYITVVLFLVTPFLLLANIYLSLIIMFAVVAVILFAISYYTSVLFDRQFKNQFGEMFSFSVAVAIISFGIGMLFKSLTGASI